MAFLAVLPAYSGLLFGTAARAIGTFALRTVASVVVAKLADNLLSKPSAQTQGAAQEAVWSGTSVAARVAAAPRELIYGRARVGGVIVYMAASGDKNQYLHMVIAIAAHKVQSIGAVYFGKDMVIDSQGQVLGQYAGYGRGPWLLIEKRLGEVNQSAFEQLKQDKPGDWTDAHRGRGVAMVHIRLEYSADLFPTGLPEITFDVEGRADVFDPRTGTTGYSRNPALCLANFMADTKYGLRLAIGTEAGISEDSLIEAANICDELVILPTGGTEQRYLIDGVVSTSKDPQTVVREMLSAMSGMKPEIAGTHYIHAGAYRSPVASLGLKDAVGQIRVTTKISMAENCNGVRGKFISPANDWQPDDFPAYASNFYTAKDGGVQRWLDIELPYTISAAMAQRLAKIELEKMRREISVEFPANFSTFAITPGDTITLNYARLGFVQKPFIVIGKELVFSGDQTKSMQFVFSLRETSPSVYDWQASEAKIYEDAPITNLPSKVTVPAPSITGATESLYQNRSGSGLSARLRLEWSPSDIFSAMYVVQGKFGDQNFQTLAEINSTSFSIDDIAVGNWNFRVAARSVFGVTSPWSPIWQQTVLGLSAPPSAMVGLKGSSLGGLFLLQWTASEDLDVIQGGKTLVRHSQSPSPSWENSVSIAAVPGQATSVVTELVAGTYLLRFQDAMGILGPVSTVYTNGAQAVQYSTIGMLQEDDEFSGTKLGTVVVSGALTLDSTTDIWAWLDVWSVPDIWSGGEVVVSGTYDFATILDLGTIKTTRLQSVIEFGSLDLNNDIWAWPDIWSVSDVWGSAEGADVVIEIATTNDNPAASPVWSSWRRLSASEETARAIKARAILSTQKPTVAPFVTKLRILSQEVI